MSSPAMNISKLVNFVTISKLVELWQKTLEPSLCPIQYRFGRHH